MWPAGPRRRVALPQYPFQRRRFWLPEPAAGVRTVALTGPEATEHRVGGRRWASGAALLEAVAADGVRLRDVRWPAPADLDVAGDRLRISVEDGKVSATAGDRIVIRALIDRETAPPPLPPTADLPLLQARCRQQIDIGDLYARLRASGLDHGPGLRSVTGLWTGDGECLARLATSASGRRWNAVLIDGALQALAPLGDGPGTWVPAGLAVATSYQEPPERCWAHARQHDAGPGRRRFDIEVLDDAGQVLLTLEGLEVAAVGAEAQTGAAEARAGAAEARTGAAKTQPSAVETDDLVGTGADDSVATTTIRYLRPTWTPAPAPTTAPTAPTPATVLLLGGGPVAEAVARQLESAGSRCVAGSGASRADFDLVLADLGEPVDAIVHVPEPDSPFEPLLWSATALLAHPEHGPVRVVAAASASVPGSVPLAAALRTLALEHSAFAAAVVQCADDPDAETVARHLIEELGRLEVSAPDTDRVREIRLARNGRWVRELAEFTPPADGDRGLELKPGAVYLLTGGAGGLGRVVARHLSGQAPVTIVLAGRSALPEPARAELAALTAPGSRIVYEQADVSRADEVEQLLTRVRRDHGEIRGLIHAAGVNRDARAVNKDPHQVAEVLGAKRDGARHLDAATAADPLDFMVFFSSVAAWTGNLGQVDYAYANACLDEFAAQRESRRAAGERSGRTVSIGWPLWTEGGMAVGDAARGWFARRWGSAPLATDDGLRALDRAMRAGESCVVVDNVLIDSARPEPVADTRRAASAEEVHALLRRLAAGFLLVDERHVDLDADLMDAGFDSISLTELVGQVNEHYDVDVSPTVLFECVNLAGFARHLVEVERVGEPQAAQTELAVPEPAQAEPMQPPLQPEPLQPAPARPEPTTPQPTTAPEPIAIVGMAAAFPGAPDLAAFWQHLTAGDDLTGPVPADRTDLRADPRTRDIRGGFLADVRTFDAAFFGVSPREAALMDPQQRLFLQTVWRAVEDAGYAPSSLAGTDTGLFAGVAASDYDDLLRAHSVEIEAHTASGVAGCVLANRVSHLLDLHGPSEAMDTACSSALVAVHRAVRAIHSGECAAALAGGVNVLLSPGLFVAFEKSGMLAADGRCKTFDATADGYARGEGVGVVYLKPLARALADGDHIHALIRGSAVNHGGRAPSLTAPNPAAQARVVAAAHRTAGVDPADVGYIETHGTGTRLGDPIEIEGLKKAFADLGADPAAAPGPWVALGSVKPNIGHLEAAAGIAGLLKTVLSLEHGQLPPTLNLTTPNPLLRLDGTPFRLNDRLRPWPEGPRVAGVSSFGFGGTNAHVVVEAAPEAAAEAAAEAVAGAVAEPATDGPHAIVLSAPSAWALTEYANRLAEFLTDRPDTDLARVAATLKYGREHLAHRVGFLASDVADAISLLRAAASEADEPRLRRAVVRATWRTAPAGPAVADETTSPEEAIAAWAAGEPHPWSGRPPRGVRRLAGVPGFPFARTVHWFTSDRLETSVTPTSPIPAAPAEPDRPKVRLAPTKKKPATAAAP
ncbi:MAG: SDR family NAD(P)-dependent oxidoreductase, partial [Catenulispora sp.]|nr:SDR family NAD(P)-dependent oxidoreductase [Catenulispora sp.]